MSSNEITPGGTRHKPPDRIGKYDVLQHIATGGMARLYMARSSGEGGFSKLVAVKQILPHMTEEEDFVRMFMDEARISAQLNHSNIAQIFEFGAADESYFIAMEYVHGVDLRQLQLAHQHNKKTVKPALAAYLLAQICAALEYAHTCRDDDGQPLRIIHRDVSPSNVLVSFEGEVKLIDFGIAKAAQNSQVTSAGTFKGKCSYLSPEQVLGHKVDRRSDIFATGSLLYELVAGQHPFRQDDDFSTLRSIRDARPAPPSKRCPGLPAEIDRICMTALAADPGDRYPSAGHMETALEEVRRHYPLSRSEMARWMKRTFAHEIARRERAIRSRGAGGALEARLAAAQKEQSPPGMTGDSARLQTLAPASPTDSGGAPDGAGFFQASTQLNDPEPVDNHHDSGTFEIPPPPLAPLPAKPPGPMRHPWRWKMALTMLLALGIVGALAYQVFYLVRRGPRMLPVPANVTEPLQELDGQVIPYRQIEVESPLKRVRCKVSIDKKSSTKSVPFMIHQPDGVVVTMRCRRAGMRPVDVELTVRRDQKLTVTADRRKRRLTIAPLR